MACITITKIAENHWKFKIPNGNRSELTATLKGRKLELYCEEVKDRAIGIAKVGREEKSIEDAKFLIENWIRTGSEKGVYLDDRWKLFL